MKKILNFLLLLAIVASVVSCGSGSKGVTPPSPPGGGGGTPPPPPPPKDSIYMKIVGETKYQIPIGVDTLIGVFEVGVTDLTPWVSISGVLQKYIPGTNEVHITNEYFWIKDMGGKTLKEGAFPLDSKHVMLDDWVPPAKGKYKILIGAKGTEACTLELNPGIDFRIKGEVRQGPGCQGTVVTFK